MKTENNEKFNHIILRSIIIVWIIQSVITFIVLATHKSDIENRVLGYYSAPRLAELCLVGLITVSFLALGIASFKSFQKREGFILLLSKKGWKEALFLSSFIIISISQASLVILQALSQHPSSQYFAVYANHLRPVFNFFTLICIEFIIWLIFIHRENLRVLYYEEKKALNFFIVALGGLTILTLLVQYFQKTQKYDVMQYLGGPTVPLLEWQIALALVFGILIMLFSATKKISFLQKDGQVAAGIWLITAVLWLSQPINPGFSATAPIAPNFEIYPFSDAQLYAQNAQSIIIGKGMAGEQFPARPLYVIFLAILHTIAGQSYTNIIVFQTLVLAVFPAILYLLGKEISGPHLGIAMAVLAIARDITINQVASFTVSVTYSKLLVSELPVAVLLSLFTLITIRWLGNPLNTNIRPLLAGGIIGLTTLIRTQSIIIVVPLFLVMAAIRKYNWKKKISHYILFVLGVVISLSPWLYRNWQLTGGIVIDNPLSQMNVFAVRYSEYDEMKIPYLPGENNSQYSKRMLAIAAESFYENPQKIITAVTSHFIQNQIGNLLVFPLRNDLHSLQELWVPTINFWENWNTPTALAKHFFITVYLFLFGVGLAAAWKKLQWLGLFPLAINLSYNLWTALFLTSGIRFIFPTDWVFYMYMILGSFSVISVVFKILGTIPIATLRRTDKFSPSKMWGSIPALLLIIAAGFSLPASEHIITDQYPEKTQEEMWQNFFYNAALEEMGKLSATDMRKIAEIEDLTIMEGRVLYPRYYEENEGIELTDKPGFKPTDHGRLVFRLIGQRTGRIIFPADTPPVFFPHAADVTILLKDNLLSKTWLILISHEGKEALYTSAAMQDALEKISSTFLAIGSK